MTDVPHVEIVYYLDVLSSWCYIGDLALARIEEKYGDAVRVDWRIAQLFGDGTVPYTREKCAWYYDRTRQISGVRLNPNWLDGPGASMAFANMSAEAARALGVADSRVRRSVARAALIEGKPAGRRECAIELTAQAAGLNAADIDRKMREPSIAERIAATTKEFDDLKLPQRPSFLLRNTSGDMAVFSGLYTFEAIDAAVNEMLNASRVTADVGPEPG